MTDALAVMLAIIRRDLLVARRGFGDTLAGAGYFAVIIALLPLAIGPGPDTLRLIGPAMIWVAALIAVLPQMERLYSRDAADGSLDDLILTPLPLPMIVLAKVTAGWIMIGLPLVVMTPLLALVLGLPASIMPVLTASIAIGSVALMLLGSMAAAIAIGARRASILIAVLILPLAMPVLIFGTAAPLAVLSGDPAFPHLALLSAATLVLLAITPVATAASLRIAAE
ncbi:MAG: heme exporter protein CcmB [Gammaproteobacteria bacterium TMED183]|nr:heme exporter protein CcmB [SAR116 cluster bacterium]OUW36685.1 MAG: heme exporter protein CcmB [Gammaproteobacteria bacterium TMED183]